MQNIKGNRNYRNITLLILLIFSLSSCSFFYNTKEESKPENKLITVSGSITEKAFLAERTAVPGSTNNTSDYSYSVTAQSKSSGEKYECTVSETSFSVSLKPGYYIFSAFGVQTGNDAGGNPNNSQTPTAKKLSGSIPVIVRADGTTTPSSISITVKPVANTFGTGSAALDISVDNANITPTNKKINSARAYWTLNGTRYYQSFSFETTDEIDNPQTFNFTANGTSTPMQMPSGSYTVQFYFSNISGSNFMNHVLYYFSEVVNIYDGFTTNTWVDSGNADYLVTTGTGDSAVTKVLVTEDCIDTFKRTNLFVSADGSDDISNDVRGTIGKPFATIAQAINAIQSRNNGTEVYTINLLNDITLAEASNSDTAGIGIIPNNNLYVIIQSCGFDDEPYYIDFNGRNGFDTQPTGSPAEYTTYLMLKDLEIKNVKSDSGISKKIANTYFGGYLIIQNNKNAAGTNTCNIKLFATTDKINLGGITNRFAAVPLDTHSKIGVTIPASVTSSSLPYTITDGYEDSLTTSIPYDIFTSDEGYAVGWNEDSDEAVVAETSGSFTPIGFGKKPFEIVFPEYPWINTLSGATVNPNLNIKFRYDGEELSGGTNNTVSDLKSYQIIVTKGSKSYGANGILVEKKGTNVSTNYSTSGSTTGIIVPASTFSSAGIDDGVYTVTVRVVYGQVNYEASQNYYITRGEPLSYFLTRKEAEYITDPDSADPAPEAADKSFLIETKDQFLIFRNMINGTWKPSWLGEESVAVSSSNFSGKSWFLMNDLDLEKAEWLSIGRNETDAFDGLFDGNNHTIKGLRLPVWNTGSARGLFGYCKGAVCNLNVEGITTKLPAGSSTESVEEAQAQYIGGIVAYLAEPDSNASSDMGKITNCSFNGSIELKTYIQKSTRSSTFKDTCIGGIVGYVYTSPASDSEKIINCRNKADINVKTQYSYSDGSYAYVNIGGICGYTGCKVKNCENYGAIVKDNIDSSSYNYPCCYVGGIAGVNAANATISDCNNYGKITQPKSVNAFLGGIVSLTSANVENCKNYGTIKIDWFPQDINAKTCGFTAGIMAKTSSSNIAVTVSNCQNYGDINSKCHRTGGIAAYFESINGAIKDCTNEGNILGSPSDTFICSDAGGIAGYVNYGKIISCINKGDVTYLGTDSTTASNVMGIGGIVGYLNDTVISCENYGNVSGMACVGGVVGFFTTGTNETPQTFSYTCINCKNTGTITAKGINTTSPANVYAGGILGKVNNPGNIIYNCINTGSITSTGSFYQVGGVIGQLKNNTKVYNCVNVGPISYQHSVYMDYRKDYVANLFCDGHGEIVEGELTKVSEIKNCFYKEDSLTKSSVGAVPKGWTKYTSGNTDVVYSPDVYESITTFVQDYKIEDSELKYRTITPIDYGDGFGNIASYLNGFINKTATTVTVGSTSYPVKKWHYTEEGQLDFITDGSSGETANRSFVLCEHGELHREGYTVNLTRDYYVCNHEVTQAEYLAIMGSNPSSFNGSSGKEPADGEIQENRPVDWVGWFDAIVYCNKRSIAAGFTPCYSVTDNGNTSTNPADWKNTETPSTTYIPSNYQSIQGTISCDFNANGYRLPTEAEWEFAARGGNESEGYTYSGANNVDEVAWYSGNSDSKTHEVMKKLPNELGIYDMSGNINEWCWDWHAESYDTSSVNDPEGPSSSSTNERILRSGCWYSAADSSKVVTRGKSIPSNNSTLGGFRVVRTAQ